MDGLTLSPLSKHLGLHKFLLTVLASRPSQVSLSLLQRSMAARVALAVASSFSRSSAAAANLVPRRGLAGGGGPSLIPSFDPSRSHRPALLDCSHSLFSSRFFSLRSLACALTAY
ncbi:hypothetical protein BHM03_00024024 [Ensete ventricosum]|nr:hypothetical protein BHM03_00024024 [Ensete ventricosum]